MDRLLLDPSRTTSTPSYHQLDPSASISKYPALLVKTTSVPKYVEVLMELSHAQMYTAYMHNATNGSDYGGRNGSYGNDTMMNQNMMVMPSFTQMSLIKTVVLSLMFVISLIGNTATLIQMYRMRRRKSTIYTLILHLATADLVVTFFCFVTDAVWSSTIQWYAGNVACKTVKFLQVFGLYLSTYIIVIVSIDRCFAILDPMSRNKAPKRVRMMIAFAWVLSALFSLPQAYVFRVARGPFKEEFWQCVTHGAYTARWQERLYSCFTILFLFFIPLVTMVVAYMLIFCTIAKKSSDLQREAENTTTLDMLSRGPVRSQLFRKAKVKSLRMTALIVAAFIVCWTPYYVVMIIYTMLDTHAINDNDVMWIFCFGMANSMLNPLIYGAFHVCKKRKRPPIYNYKTGNNKPATTTSSDTGKGSSSQSRGRKGNGEVTHGTFLDKTTPSYNTSGKRQLSVTYHFSI